MHACVHVRACVRVLSRSLPLYLVYANLLHTQLSEVNSVIGQLGCDYNESNAMKHYLSWLQIFYFVSNQKPLSAP